MKKNCLFLVAMFLGIFLFGGCSFKNLKKELITVYPSSNSTVIASPGDVVYDYKKEVPFYAKLSAKILHKDYPTKYEQQLIYGGYSNHTIFLQYREFINDFARPAFYQDLKYQCLKFPCAIGFKKIKFKILKIENNKIKYLLIN